MRGRRTFQLIVLGLVCLFLGVGCSGRKAYAPPYKAKTVPVKKARQANVKKALPRMGYTIQAGAFSQPENAARFTEILKDKGLDATYFAAKTGLYKVRIGNFAARESALNQAEALKILGLIEEYYIVAPEEYAVSKVETLGDGYLRNEIVKAAQSFLGVPYLWGGASPEVGFDCSGLTMTVYQLSGIDLPRTSGEQFRTGDDVDKDDLLKGDLIFFATAKGSKVSHVGVYIGDGRFIHAPGKGKKICIDSLSNAYYHKRYLGGRTYI
ncbi:MAG: NlpC/P60 family protein [Syntrophales bacterium]|nr:NlpC/P60 family protein [Syntrophales bacterium]